MFETRMFSGEEPALDHPYMQRQRQIAYRLWHAGSMGGDRVLNDHRIRAFAVEKGREWIPRILRPDYAPRRIDDHACIPVRTAHACCFVVLCAWRVNGRLVQMSLDERMVIVQTAFFSPIEVPARRDAEVHWFESGAPRSAVARGVDALLGELFTVEPRTPEGNMWSVVVERGYAGGDNVGPGQPTHWDQRVDWFTNGSAVAIAFRMKNREPLPARASVEILLPVGPEGWRLADFEEDRNLEEDEP